LFTEWVSGGGEKKGEKKRRSGESKEGRAKKKFSSCTNSQICKGM
jgi:hypothetical protein